MAYYKSAKKRIKVAARNQERNNLIKSRVRTAMKNVVKGVDNSSEDLEALTKVAISQLDKAKSKGVFHKKTIDRYKSRLMKKVNAAS